MTRAVAWRRRPAGARGHLHADEDADARAETRHSTAQGAAELAAEAEVKLLALTHISSRYPVGALQDEARAAFENTIVPRDFDRVELPFPERGDPDPRTRSDGPDV